MNYEAGRVKKTTVPLSKDGRFRRVPLTTVRTAGLFDELETDDDAVGAGVNAGDAGLAGDFLGTAGVT